MNNNIDKENKVDSNEKYKLDIPYEQVPWFRKRWFLFLSLLTFTPLAIILAATGDFYRKDNGHVYKFCPEHKTRIILVACLLLAFGVFRFYIAKR